MSNPVTLHTPKAAAAAEAAEELAIAEARLETAQHEALVRRIGSADLAAQQDEADLARLRAKLAQTTADEERANLATDDEIHAAIRDMLTDPTLDTQPLAEAFTRLEEALTHISKVNDDRNTAVTAWVNRLRDLGLPDRGVTIGDDELTIYTSASSGTQVTIGRNRIEGLRNLAPLIAHTTKPHTRGATTAPTNPDTTLSRLNRRADTSTTPATVKLTKPLGGKPAGHVLTTAEISPANLSRLVRNGAAELLEGELPTTPEHHRTFLPAGSDTTPIEGNLTPRERAQRDTDTDIVDAAVKGAFA